MTTVLMMKNEMFYGYEFSTLDELKDAMKWKSISIITTIIEYTLQRSLSKGRTPCEVRNSALE